MNDEVSSFADLIHKLDADGLTPHVWALEQLLAAPKGTIERITELLSAQGISQLADNTLGGRVSIVVEVLRQNKVVRVVDVSYEHSPVENAHILQPIKCCGVVNGFRVQIFPKVQMLAQALENGILSLLQARIQIEALFQKIEQQGMLFWDCKFSNLCVVDGKILLVDPGAVCLLSEADGGQVGRDTKSNREKYVKNRIELNRLLTSSSN